MKTSTSLAAAFMLFATYAVAEPRQENRGPVRTVHELVLNDGSRIYGQIEAESDVEIVFRTAAGAVVHAPRSQVVSLKPVAGRMIQGEFRRDDPNSTRLLFGPTGRAIPRGQTYLGVYEVLVPFVQVGVTNQFSIGGGTPLIFETDGWQRLYWLTPKLQVYSDGRTHASVGVFQGFAGGDGDSAGIAYGVVTHDTDGGAFTVGAGMGYTSEGDRGGVLMLGGESSARRNIKFITENYFWRSAVVTSGGCRFFGEHLSADLAIAVAFGEDSTFAFPVVNFVYRF